MMTGFFCLSPACGLSLCLQLKCKQLFLKAFERSLNTSRAEYGFDLDRV